MVTLARIVLIAGALLVLLTPGRVAAQISGGSFTPCPVAPALTEIEGETVVCGTVRVPENYDKTDGAQIDLAYAILKSTSLSPAADPVIYLHGGPGAAELHELARMSERFASLRQSRDVILFDQRGTGFSPGPLTCDVEFATQRDDIEAYADEYAGGYGNKEAAVNRALFAICLQHFEEIGADLSQYNTVNNARDVVELATALGYGDKLNLYGFSYGTQVALEIMRRYPEQLRSVILDSVAPADLKLYENMGQPNVEAIDSLLTLCAEDDGCSAAYPDLRARFPALLDRLDRTPLTRTDGATVTSATVVNALGQSDIRPGLGAYLPRMIDELDRGEYATLDAILNHELPPPSVEPDPLALRYAGRDLGEDTLILVRAALDLRQEAGKLYELAERLLRRGEEVLTAEAAASTPAGRFDRGFHEAVNGLPFDRRLAVNEAYLAFPLAEDGPTLAGLQRFIDAHFDGADARHLRLLADAMNDEDVAALAEIVFGKARSYATYFNVALALNLYVCQEHMPFNTLDGALERFEALAIPPVARRKWGTVSNLMAYCELFPTGRAAKNFHEPVVSDLPALILLGSADTQTAISWGMHAAENLVNSQTVIFPETGHGAIRFSRCAKDIGAAFLNDPDGDLNTSCVVDLLPEFVMPTVRP